jgi:yecA family protein
LTERAPYVADYDTLADALAEAGISASAAEIHGIVCATACTGGTGDRDWRELAFGAELSQVPVALVDLLSTLHRHTEAQLAGTELEFEPLLPPDDVDMGARIEALAEWCRGFLLGIGMTRGADAPAFSADTRELLDDFADIAKAEPETGDDSEELERALEELAEYLRVGVELLYDELHPRERKPK